MKLSRNDLFRAGLLFLAIFIAHANFLFPAVAENPDSNFIYPFISSIHSFTEYISKLVTLETIDFQPVRDLTLFVDVWFQNHFQLNVSIFLNCLIWGISCWEILEIIDRYIRVVDKKTSLFVVACYAVYPIFLQTINWGISRKHLLAFMFILLATRAFLEWMETHKGRLKMIVFYTLSVLSLPMSIGWPVWCFCYLWLKDKKKLKESVKPLIFLNIIMILLVLINYAYYNTSLTYLELYPKKASIISPVLIALNLGQQVWQLLFPYQLAFHYSFRDGAVVGVCLFIGAMIYLCWKHQHRKDVWAWLLYAGAHSAIVLSTPTLYYDTYILSPSFGLLIALLLLSGERLGKFRNFLIPCFVFWISFTLYQNKTWGTSEDFFANSFRHDESCNNAIGLGLAKYSGEKKIPNDLYNFIQVNTCFEPVPGDSPSLILKKILFESMSLYYEDEIDLEYRKSRLVEMGKKHFYPLTVYAVLLSQEENDEEIETVMKRLNDSFGSSGIIVGKGMPVVDRLRTYCERKELPECRKFVRNSMEK